MSANRGPDPITATAIANGRADRHSPFPLSQRTIQLKAMLNTTDSGGLFLGSIVILIGQCYGKCACEPESSQEAVYQYRVEGQRTSETPK